MAKATVLQAGAPLTGLKFLLILAGGFGVVFAVNALMAYDAISTFRGEVVDNPYEVGLEYNSQIAAAKAQSERHWKVDVALSREESRATFRDAAGAPIDGLKVKGVFAAPADMKRDRAFALREIGPGVYVGEAAPPAGVWDFELTAMRGEATLFKSKNRVKLP